MKLRMQSIFIHTILSVFFLIGCTKSNSSQKLSPLLEKYIEYWNTGEFMGIEETLHPEFELRMSPDFEPEKGIVTFKETVIKWRTSYPDFHIDVNEWIYDSYKIAVRWTITATNTGPGSHPPTGKHIKVMGMSIIHFENGKIRDEWISSNDLLWMTQLGFNLTPPKTDSEK